MRKWKWVFLITGTVLFFSVGSIIYWQRGESRRAALSCVLKLDSALSSASGELLLDQILIPTAIQSRTQAEQIEFLTKALADEISPAGVAALKQSAVFGSLKKMFPEESVGWASQAGVNADDCVAFKMERAGIRAEVVMLREGSSYRVIRCNNVKQMAEQGEKQI